jgi:hypothetical protein
MKAGKFLTFLEYQCLHSHPSVVLLGSARRMGAYLFFEILQAKGKG